MEHDPLQNDLRRARRARSLGPDAHCVLCGERNPEALRRAKRTLLERHHIFGDANDPDATVVVCLNCHAKLTEAQRSHGVDLEHDPERAGLEVLAAVLDGVCALLHVVADALALWAARVRDQVCTLDAALPQWRALPEVSA